MYFVKIVTEADHCLPLVGSGITITGVHSIEAIEPLSWWQREGINKWQKYVLARTSLWIPHSSVSRDPVLRTVSLPRFAKENTTKSLR